MRKTFLNFFVSFYSQYDQIDLLILRQFHCTFPLKLIFYRENFTTFESSYEMLLRHGDLRGFRGRNDSRTSVIKRIVSCHLLWTRGVWWRLVFNYLFINSTNFTVAESRCKILLSREGGRWREAAIIDDQACRIEGGNVSVYSIRTSGFLNQPLIHLCAKRNSKCAFKHPNF